MTRDLIIIGCGGFGREVADVVDAINSVRPTWNLVGFVDDSPSPDNLARLDRRGTGVIGDLNELSDEAAGHFVVGIGNGQTRRLVEQRASGLGWRPATLIHPSSAIGANCQLGEGTVVCAYVTVGSDVAIGRHVHLDRGVQVGHDSVIGDFVTAHPAAVISGDCEIQSDAELGTNSTVLPRIRIGKRAVVAAAACVVKDVPQATIVKGVPARPRSPLGA